VGKGILGREINSKNKEEEGYVRKEKDSSPTKGLGESHFSQPLSISENPPGGVGSARTPEKNRKKC